MKIRLQVLVVMLFVILIVASACSSKSSTSTQASNLDGATLVQERCTACHTLSRVESKHYTAKGWKATVNLMISKGASLTAEEKTAVINYLSSNYGQ